MAQVKIKCDRCGEWVEGLLSPGMTAGFYAVYQELIFKLNENSEPRKLHDASAWAAYGREGEEYICDHCMWLDPKYIETYHYDAEALRWRQEQGIE